jgi:AraC family transcriptional regulator, regulatory protein of adaptative response / methylated-DNA-[protein]-cysteine methyltransferase
MKTYIERDYHIIEPARAEKPEFGWYVGNKTTKLACTSNCKSSSKEDWIFSKHLVDLLSDGFSECNVCKPLSSAANKELAPFLEQIQLTELPDKQWEEGHEEANRWVEEHHQVSLNHYIQVKRVNYLLRVKSREFFNTIVYKRYWTPIGMMLACFSDKGLCLLEFFDRLMLEGELFKLQLKLKANFKEVDENSIAKQLDIELKEYFSGKRKQFSIQLYTVGSPFQQAVWAELEKIPYGETRSYQRQADSLGKIKAVRAVANANGQNKISIIIPCHRVIGTNGQLTGYGGGLPRKKFLLDLEFANCC